MELYQVSWMFCYWDEYENQYGKSKFFRCFVYAKSSGQAEQLAEQAFNKLYSELPDDSYNFQILKVAVPMVILPEEF